VPGDLEDGEFELRPMTTDADLQACVALQRTVWGEHFADIVPAGMLRVVQQIGGVAVGAFTHSGTLAGFIFGITGIREGRITHWSDALAVHEQFRSRGLGERLKRRQREMLVTLGVEHSYWTFDPLESRNAYLNFARLGVTAREYHRDYYGDSASRLHQGIGTDRLVVLWEITSDRVARRLAGERFKPAADALRAIPVVNPPRVDGVVMETTTPDLTLDAPRVRIAIPGDIQRLKSAAPDAAVEWRQASRLAFETYFARGYVAVEVVREGPASSYILARA
jgi:predicted GNAT superfamily acetyltransferase